VAGRRLTSPGNQPHAHASLHPAVGTPAARAHAREVAGGSGAGTDAGGVEAGDPADAEAAARQRHVAAAELEA